MTFTQIKTFYLVATMGTFQSAAEKLNTSQPTVSARIVALENWLGIKLFDRSTHRAQLTPEGRTLLDVAKKMLDLQSDAMRRVGGGTVLKGIYRIGAADTLAVSWLPPFMVDLQARYPEAVFEFEIGGSPDLRDQLIAQSLDVCFIVGPVADPTVVNHLLCETPVVLAAAPALQLHGRPVTMDELANHNILTFGRRTHTYHSIRRRLDKEGLNGRLCAISSLNFAVLLAQEGFGVLALPAVSIQRELDDGTLVALNVDFTPDYPQFAICYREGPLRAVAESIAQHALVSMRSFADRSNIKLLYEEAKDL